MPDTAPPPTWMLSSFTVHVLEIGTYWWQAKIEHEGHSWNANGYTPGDAVNNLWAMLLQRHDIANVAERTAMEGLPNA